jgi:hypothetical protein
VVLHHTGVEDPHYDLLFEPAEGAALVTFRLREWPPARGQEVRRLKDHRRLYLSYEGNIPGDRGYVVRVDDSVVRARAVGPGWSLSRPDGDPWLTLEPLADQGPDVWWLQPSPTERNSD